MLQRHSGKINSRACTPAGPCPPAHTAFHYCGPYHVPPDCDLVGSKRLAHIHRPDLLDRFLSGRLCDPFLRHFVIQVLVKREINPIVGPGGQMHGIRQRQSVDSLFTGAINGVPCKIASAKFWIIPLCADYPRDRHLAFPAFRFAESPVYCRLNSGSGTRRRQKVSLPSSMTIFPRSPSLHIGWFRALHPLS